MSENINKKAVNESHKKHNHKRTKVAQSSEMSKGTKRRVNITVSGQLWDMLELLDITNKSNLIESMLQNKLKYEGLI